jgi:SAM-dependent methyltransferase
MTQDRSSSWSQYWSTGALHSCAGSFVDNYDESIAAFWREVFAPLTAADRILDVATGNGALPRLLVDSRAVPTSALPAVDAIDLANIDPPWLIEYPDALRSRLRFHAGVAVESLPFADASFDLVISQYGLEYTHLDASIDELLRVMKPAAQVALVTHHHDSLPVRLGRAEVLEIDWLLQSGGLLQRVRRLLPYLARLATAAGMASVQRDPEAAKVRQRFNESMREMQQRLAASVAGDILAETQDAIGRLMGQVAANGLRRSEAALGELVAGLRDARLRQAELVAHALDADAIQAIAARFAARGHGQPVLNELRVQGELFGWSLRTLAS